MTKKEYEKCVKIMIDGIIHGDQSEKCFLEIRENKELPETTIKVKELQGQNYLGYAQGINQVLVSLGFKHDRMKELQKFI